MQKFGYLVRRAFSRSPLFIMVLVINACLPITIQPPFGEIDSSISSPITLPKDAAGWTSFKPSSDSRIL